MSNNGYTYMTQVVQGVPGETYTVSFDYRMDSYLGDNTVDFTVNGVTTEYLNLDSGEWATFTTTTTADASGNINLNVYVDADDQGGYADLQFANTYIGQCSS
ncbi:hypothetical protein SEUCBS139899_010857 [Sporothrix eucalyptigena]|uniref:CBM-cenC domain-containing protein n=1 Tax=Sporothrix eucalyptigena TaxID=1812306 RepID=A0ABP0D2G6_9PEZI